MLAAPLLAGNDITTMTPYVKSVLTHEELIAINQDPLVFAPTNESMNEISK